MVAPVSDVPVKSGASGRWPTGYSTVLVLTLTSLAALPLPWVRKVTARAAASSTAATAVVVTTVRRLPLNTSGFLTAAIFRGRPPCPRCPAGTGLTAENPRPFWARHDRTKAGGCLRHLPVLWGATPVPALLQGVVLTLLCPIRVNDGTPGRHGVGNACELVPLEGEAG